MDKIGEITYLLMLAAALGVTDELVAADCCLSMTGMTPT